MLFYVIFCKKRGACATPGSALDMCLYIYIYIGADPVFLKRGACKARDFYNVISCNFLQKGGGACAPWIRPWYVFVYIYIYGRIQYFLKGGRAKPVTSSTMLFYVIFCKKGGGRAPPGSAPDMCLCIYIWADPVFLKRGACKARDFIYNVILCIFLQKGGGACAPHGSTPDMFVYMIYVLCCWNKHTNWNYISVIL